MLTLKKSLGQHFLKDEQVSLRIVQVLKERPFKRLFEVGPGAGALTKHLVTLPQIDFRLTEIDLEKVSYLQRRFPDLRGKISHDDILTAPRPFDEPFTMWKLKV